MDLIGLDTNFAVTRSVYAAYFYDKRYTPSLLQQELVDAGLLGRKSGRGFYDYSEPAEALANEFVAPLTLPSTDSLSVHGSGPVADRFARVLEKQACVFERIESSDWCGLQVAAAQLRLTDGRPASQLGTDVAVFDLPLADDTDSTLAWSHAAAAGELWINEAPQWLAICGFQPQRIADTPGLVVARTIAMLINEAADAVQQGVCSEADADSAMKLGLNYPAGPFEWLASWDTNIVIELLDRMDSYYRGERYRVSPWLRRQGWRRRDE
jgi:3-hydroxybutyryl-CoA dehydrogenase